MNSTIENFSPGLVPVETGNFRSDTDNVREYLTRRYLPYSIIYINKLANLANTGTQQFGADVAAATSIQFTSFAHVVTGTHDIATIQVPGAPINFAGQLVLVAQDGFNLVTGGNVAAAKPVPVGMSVVLIWNPKRQMWYPAS